MNSSSNFLRDWYYTGNIRSRLLKKITIKFAKLQFNCLFLKLWFLAFCKAFLHSTIQIQQNVHSWGYHDQTIFFYKIICSYFFDKDFMTISPSGTDRGGSDALVWGWLPPGIPAARQVPGWSQRSSTTLRWSLLLQSDRRDSKWEQTWHGEMTQNLRCFGIIFYSKGWKILDDMLFMLPGRVSDSNSHLKGLHTCVLLKFTRTEVESYNREYSQKVQSVKESTLLWWTKG